jgi:lipoic acid synthetase
LSKIKSGDKFKTAQGFSAIKNGMKNKNSAALDVDRKPPWLRVGIGGGKRYQQVRETVNTHKLATVCEESHCPNIGECWNHGTATIMLMGATCTRACKFCAVDTGNPGGWLDLEEPANAAKSVQLMGLGYVVLTSVDRDDLDDGGAQHYANCIQAIKRVNPNTAVEALTPDFSGNRKDVAIVANSGLEVFAQNLETVERLTHVVRDPRAGYQQTLDVLAYAKQSNAKVLTKSSLMLGIGETDEEIETALQDLFKHNVDIVTLGQYMRPTKNHLPVDRWVTPEQFEQFREYGLSLGFMEVASGPLVRSSYRADKVFAKNNLGLSNKDAISVIQL